MFKTVLYLTGIATLYLLIRYFYFMPLLVFGEQSPTFSETGINRQIISSESLKGNYVLLDFWGSWCLPCRNENKILKLMYERYKNSKFPDSSGFKIVSIALENNVEQAVQAIESDQLPWTDHIIQTDMLESSLAKLFGIKQVPYKYLVGPDGKIILSNPDFKELDDYLAHFQVKKLTN